MGYNERYMEKWHQAFESKVRKIRKYHARAETKEIVLDFIRYKQSQGLGYPRLTRVSDFIWHLVANFDLSLKELKQQEVQEVVIWINKQKWKDWTKANYVRIFKNFLFWLNDRHNLGLKLKEVKVVTPKNSLLPDYLLTSEELNKLLNSMADPQDRLLFGLMYESACRVSEITSMTPNSVTFNNYGAKIQVKGKTGQRVIPIVWNAGLLKQFLENHPNKNNPDSFLWYYQDEKGEYHGVNSDMLRMRLRRACQRLGIKKNVHPHLLRHTRLTELAKDLPEQTLKAYAGWTADSKMAQTYIHLSSKDIEDSLLTKVYGIKVNGDGKKETWVCPRCHELNAEYSKLCSRCAGPLDAKELAQETMSADKMKEVEDWSKKFMAFLKVVEKKHPDIWKDMKEVVG
jgi:integrase/recombinase XerD